MTILESPCLTIGQSREGQRMTVLARTHRHTHRASAWCRSVLIAVKIVHAIAILTEIGFLSEVACSIRYTYISTTRMKGYKNTQLSKRISFRIARMCDREFLCGCMAQPGRFSARKIYTHYLYWWFYISTKKFLRANTRNPADEKKGKNDVMPKGGRKQDQRTKDRQLERGGRTGKKNEGE